MFENPVLSTDVLYCTVLYCFVYNNQTVAEAHISITMTELMRFTILGIVINNNMEHIYMPTI